MKVLIIGGNGQLGKSLCNTKPENLDLISYSKEEFNLLDIDNCLKKIEKVKPNYVINAAAYTAVDKAETESELVEIVNAKNPYKIAFLLENPLQTSPSLGSTMSLVYLGIVATGLAWLIRFRILTVNGLVFQTQVAYLIPIFGVFFGFFLMDEIITWRVLLSLVIIILGIYIVKKNNRGIDN